MPFAAAAPQLGLAPRSQPQTVKSAHRKQRYCQCSVDRLITQATSCTKKARLHFLPVAAEQPRLQCAAISAKARPLPPWAVPTAMPMPACCSVCTAHDYGGDGRTPKCALLALSCWQARQPTALTCCQHPLALRPLLPALSPPTAATSTPYEACNDESFLRYPNERAIQGLLCNQATPHPSSRLGSLTLVGG